MTQHDSPSPATITACTVIAVGGMLVAQRLRTGRAFLLSPETLLPVAALRGCSSWPRVAERSGTAVRTALVVWVLLNLVGGGVLSVLPLAGPAIRP